MPASPKNPSRPDLPDRRQNPIFAGRERGGQFSTTAPANSIQPHKSRNLKHKSESGRIRILAATPTPKPKRTRSNRPRPNRPRPPATPARLPTQAPRVVLFAAHRPKPNRPDPTRLPPASPPRPLCQKPIRPKPHRTTNPPRMPCAVPYGTPLLRDEGCDDARRVPGRAPGRIRRRRPYRGVGWSVCEPSS